ncbi:MAG: pyrophosphatase [Paenibacillaceae bacterium]|nr:pyrophosphatase [Paenibacillaceae bacterium]
MNLSELQQDVKQICERKGWDKSTIEQRTLFLVTEIGEVAREVLELSYHPGADTAEQVKERLGLEMYDVIWNLCELANKLGIDLEQAAQQKIRINKDRVWE